MKKYLILIIPRNLAFSSSLPSNKSIKGFLSLILNSIISLLFCAISLCLTISIGHLFEFSSSISIIFLAGDKRKAFILEMHSMTQLIRKNDWDQFYNIADVVMQKYS